MIIFNVSETASDTTTAEGIHSPSSDNDAQQQGLTAGIFIDYILAKILNWKVYFCNI